MDVSTMISQLGLRLEDAAKRKFTDVLLLASLEDAQLDVANLLHNDYLTELLYTKSAVTATNGELALTTGNLTYQVLKGAQGILAVKINGGLWCTEEKITDMKKTENTFLDGTTRNPLYNVFGNKILVDNGQTSPVIDVYFLRVPTTLRYTFTSNQADSGASTTKFDGLTGEGLMEAAGTTYDDYYNGAVIYNTTKQTYHVVTSYDGEDLEFTVSPAASTSFTEGQEFYFITHGFNTLTLSGVTCDLNPGLHTLVLDWAEGLCWGMDNQQDRKSSVMAIAKAKIDALNAMKTEIQGIGTSTQKRGGR